MDLGLFKMPKMYIDCYFFSKLNKLFFLGLFVTQLLQSMGFNCIFDLPQLFMMLIFTSFFSFRKKAFIAYQFYVLFFVVYCALSVYIKLAYSILIHTKEYEAWYRENAKTTTVKVLSATFGQRITLEGDEPLSDSHVTAYRIAIACSFIFSHAWLIAKCSTIREQTSYLERGTGILTRWRFAAQFKNQIFTAKQQTEQCIKIVRKKNKDKDKESNAIESAEKLLNPSNWDIKSLAKSDFLTSLKEDFNFYVPSLNIWFIRFGFGFQAYIYHSRIGLFHLTYVLLTFVFSRKFTYYMSIVIILPIYALEFIVIYGIGIPGFNEKEFVANSAYFTPVSRKDMVKLGSPMWE